MKRAIFYFAFFGLLLTGLLGCAPEQNIVVQPSVQPKTDARITSPDLNKEITSPLIIRGELTRSFFFEGTFPVVLKDGNGKEIASQNAQSENKDSTEEMIPFSVTLTFQTPSTKKGILVLEKDNASGLPANDDSRTFPVIFAQNAENAKADLVTYNNEKYLFQLQYPANFPLSPSFNQNTMILIRYPDSYYKGTNLQEATIDIMASNNLADCETNKANFKKTVVKNNITFSQEIWYEGAAGHKGDYVLYHGVHSGNCFKILLSMNSVNIDMFANDQGGLIPGAPKAFDSRIIVDMFEQIFSTFKFT